MAAAAHMHLDCGIELGAAPMADRHVVSMELRVLTGTADEPADRLGLARLIRETIDKGTAKRDGRALLDAFDELGASLGSWIGREATGFACLCLPEFVDRAVELHAEFLRSPTFPEDAVATAIALAEQEIAALEDDPTALADKLIGLQGFGPVLGRHPLGERETLARIGREDLVEHWQSHYSAGRMQVSVAGPVDPQSIAEVLDRHFGGWGNNRPGGRDPRNYTFEPARSHHPKDIEQEQIAICFPSAAATDDDFPAERVMLGVLAGGMSARLFTEVREKQGLAYDVHAGHENPRAHGMIFVSASCKPERAETTFQTLLREIDRLSEDLTEDELQRAATRLIAREETLTDMTRSRRNALAFDLFHHGHPIGIDERIERIRAVTVEDLVRYLQTHPRNRLSIVTLGPASLTQLSTAGEV
ncbi:MAG: M16 family metallopeptidase [Planctomycetota bacterium]